MPDAAQLVGEQIAYHRKRLGLSQVELAGMIGRSGSWVSQVERGVRSVDRLSVLQKVADTLGVPVTELRGSDQGDAEAPDTRPEAFESLRLTLTGHPVAPEQLSAERQARYSIDLALAHSMRRQIGESLRYLQLAEELTPEQTRTHRVARAVARDLLQLSGPRVRPELRELAERFGVSA